MNNQKDKGFSDAIKMISIPMTTYESSVALQRELVKALKNQHEELITAIGDVFGHSMDEECSVCALISRASEELA